MRLICPSCSAQYEIPDSVIPASGREVECSSCAHVWHQPGAVSPEIPVESAPLPPPEPPEPEEEFDVDQRPMLNRKLDDSVLSILREEAARELTARKADPATATGADHIPAMDESEATLAPAAEAASVAEDQPAAARFLPGSPLESDAASDAATPVEPQPQVAPAPAEPETERTPPPLPDAARLAATLTRPMPIPEPGTAEAAAEPPAPPRPPAAPPVSAAPRRNGYAMGFGLAVMLALGLLAFYALAPRPEPGAGASPASEWRQGLDRGRLWLHDRFTTLRGGAADE